MEQSNFSRRGAADQRCDIASWQLQREDREEREDTAGDGDGDIAYDTHTLVNSLHVLHHLIEATHEMGAVDLGQGGVVPAERLGLVDELLPTGVAGEQGPLFPPGKGDR